MEKRAIVISGPSGVGKSTICSELVKIKSIWKSVSTTTRQKRPDEIEGVHYFFVTREEFEEKIRNDEFLEWAVIHNNYYGTLRKPVEDALQKKLIVLFEIDIQGAESIRKKDFDVVTIFIKAPSQEELENRISKRMTESKKDSDLRLARAEEELAASKKYDYIVINDSVERAVNEIKEIIRKKFAIEI